LTDLSAWLIVAKAMTVFARQFVRAIRFFVVKASIINTRTGVRLYIGDPWPITRLARMATAGFTAELNASPGSILLVEKFIATRVTDIKFA
jgi:hypothetical protein